MDEGPKSAPLVTAIIVVLDGETFIRDAIDSIMGQTLSDWELIVVDDGSTDGTAAIVRNYQRERPRQVRLITHPGERNCGIAASRNLGLKEARGTYIGFLDADDIWTPGKLAEQVAILEEDPSLGIIYGRSLIWYSWDKASHPSVFYYPLGVEPNRRYEPPVLFELLLENKAQTPTVCSALIRASLFRSLGGFDPTFRRMFEDLTFFAKALALAPVYVSDRTWSKYRQHPKSCSAISAAAGTDEAARLVFLRWLNASIGDFKPSFRVRRAIWRALAKVTFLNAKRLLHARLRALR